LGRRPGGVAAIRSLVDCLIATVAINADASLLHADSDFDLIAQTDRPPARRYRCVIELPARVRKMSTHPATVMSRDIVDKCGRYNWLNSGAKLENVER
jgi:hypothetical protein